MVQWLVELVVLERDVIADDNYQWQLLEVLVHDALQLCAHLRVRFARYFVVIVVAHLWQCPLVVQKRLAKVENVHVSMRHHLYGVVFDSSYCVVHG